MMMIRLSAWIVMAALAVSAFAAEKDSVEVQAAREAWVKA